MTRSALSLVTFATGEYSLVGLAKLGHSLITTTDYFPPTDARGTRFQYTYYYPNDPMGDDTRSAGLRLSRSNASSTISPEFPIYASIEALDRQAMDILTLPPSTSVQAHDHFAQYLSRTKNTICGRHPIGVLLGALSEIERGEEGERKNVSMKWVRYEQSSQCRTISDSSVSYASAYVAF